MRGNGKKLVSLLLSVVLLLGFLPGQVQAAAAANSLVYVITVGEIHQDEAREVLVKVNQERAKRGIKPVAMIDELEGLAVQRAVEQLANFEHVRPDGTPWNTIWEEQDLIIYGQISENIAFGYEDATKVMEGWMASTLGHRENILNPVWNYVGIGCFEYEGVKYWAQFFAEELDEANDTPADATGITGEYPAAYWLDTDFLQKEAEVPKTLSMRFAEPNSILDPNDAEYQSALFDLAIFAGAARGERLLGIVFTGSLDETNLTIPKDAPFTLTEENEIVPAKDGTSGTYRLTARIGNLTANKDIEVRFACKHPAASQTTERQEPTCTKPGKVKVTCTLCGVVISEKTLETVPHSMGDWKIVTEANCTSKGKKERICTKCNGAKESQEIEALGHASKETVKKEATCTEAGEKVTVCSRCNIELKKETIPAKGHTWGEWKTTVWPSWDTEGEEEKACSACGVKEKRTLPSLSTGHEHSFKGTGTVKKEPTCTETGIKEIPCDNPNCSEKLEEVIAAKGHDNGTWTTTEEPSCTKTGVAVRKCGVCKATLETKVLDKIEHTWNKGEVTKEAGCTEEGIKRYTCTTCKTTREEAIAALGHKSKEVVTEAKCTTEGKKEFICERCNDKLGEETIPMLGHDWSDWKVVKEATWDEEGEKVRTCSRCDEKEKSIIQKESDTHEHDFNGKETVIKEATCTEEGTKEVACTNPNCDGKLSVQILPLGHDEVEEITKEATCTEEGEKVVRCTRCEEERTEKIVKAAHAYGDWKVTKEATEKQEGERQRVCKVCGEIEKEVISKTKPSKPGITTGDKENGDKKTPTNSTSTKNSVKTGDKAPVIAIVVVMLLAAGAILVVAIRKIRKK